MNDRREIHLGKFLALCFQLALLALVIRQFQIESKAFLRISLLAFAGFGVHYFLPLRLRLPFFVLLSFGGIVLVFGAASAAWLIGFGAVLIGICHLPVAYAARVALLLAAGAGLIALRSEWIHGPWSQAIWPILASMFMFRTIVYLYDMKHERGTVSPWRTLGYFFLLPNVCFPLFPVVDFKTFGRTYYDGDRHRIYQTGVDWMVRGIVQLIVYRLIYYYLTIAPAEVIDPDSLTRYVVTNFLLYLRISGSFHVIVGMLHLYGFNLPETNRLYCLSSSFTDFWRRINIYWKDFMIKVFYYPIYFRLRKSGETRALVVATLAVFAITWALHSWQWYWLRGSFPIIWQDALFWSALGVLVLANSLREMKHGRRRALGTTAWSSRDLVVRGLTTAGVFLFICLIWSLWSAESLASWLSMWDFLGTHRSPDARLFPGYALAVALVVFVGAIFLVRDTGGKEAKAPTVAAARTWRPAPATALLLPLLAVAGVPAAYLQLGPDAANTIVSLRSPHLSRADAAALERGYYEDLTRVDRFNSQLWEIYMKKPALHWLDVESGGLVRFTGDFLEKEYVPGFNADTPYGKIAINRWGMRDMDYEAAPGPGTYRIVMLGASSVMGWGVEQPQTFEARLEARLNAEQTGARHDRYEILNMAVAGYYPLQQVPALEKALQYEPGAVFYVATGRELSRTAWYLSDAVRAGRPIPYPFLRNLVARARIDVDTDETTATKRLAPFHEELLAWMYNTIASTCRERNVLPVWVFLPSIEGGSWEEETAPTRELARQAGFLLMDLSGLWGDAVPDELRLNEADNHPNARAHDMIADRLYALMLKHADVFFQTPSHALN